MYIQQSVNAAMFLMDRSGAGVAISAWNNL